MAAKPTTIPSPSTSPSAAPGVTGAQSIHRAIALLRAIAARGREGARLVDVARQCQLERSTAHRILKSLALDGMVAHDPESHRYLLGHLAFELGLVATPEFNLRQLCEPTLLRLAERTGDIVFLSVRSGLDTVCTDRKEGPFPIKALTLDVGTRRPLGVGSSGLALLMPLPAEEAKEIVATNAWRISEYGNLRASTVLEMLDRARENGYAVNEQQVFPGVVSVGLYIATPRGTPYGAIAIGAIASRMTAQHLQEVTSLLKSEVRTLEQRLKDGRKSP